MSLNRRYDFVLLFDVVDGNPNGDPDAGNLPRTDPESGNGLVTDVCLKRKVRNFVALTHNYSRPNDIYVRERAVLGHSHVEAFKTLNLKLGEASQMPISQEYADSLSQLELPPGVTIGELENESSVLEIDATVDRKELKDWIKENTNELSKAHKKILEDALKQMKGRQPTKDESDQGKAWLCKNFFDIRTFGAVLSLKSAPNCGQVRGPIQLTFARSIDPITTSEHSITRMAVATQAEADKQQGDNRTMGRKFTVPYGLYRAHGFISAHLAQQTGFSEADLALFWLALMQMFEHDRSAARGLMSARGLYVFEHDSALGNAPAHALFDLIDVKRKAGVEAARQFAHYEVAVDETKLPKGVTLHRKIG